MLNYKIYVQKIILNLIKERKNSSENWENLDFSIYNDDINLSINNIIWVKAFHGTERNCKNENEIRDMVDSILKNGFKNGFNNAHADCYDIYHPGRRIGIGVYVTS